MTTVVSLVPLPMERDTRTIKIAASLARLGFRSIVVESAASRRRDRGPVELRTLALCTPRPDPAAAPPPADRRPRGQDTSWRRRMRERLHFVAFLLRYFVWLPVLGLLRVPAADLYYLHEYRLFPTVWLARRLKRRAPLIYDAHDVYADVWEPEQLSPFWNRWFVPLLLAMERACARDAAAVVTVGTGVADRIGQLLDVRPQVLRNCQDRRLGERPEQTLRQRLGLGADAIVVAVIGHRKPGQAVEPLIAALAQLPDRLHVAFVGSYYDEVEDLARRHGVSGRVHAPGAMASEKMVGYVADCDAAALLYWAHSANTKFILPNGFFQAITAGLPLLYPALPEIEAAIGARRVGWCIDPRDRDSMATALTALLSTDPVAHTQMKAEIAALGEELNWEREEEKLALLVAAVLEKTN